MIQTVVQEMIEALIQHKPQNVPLFMRNWLLKRAKVTSTGLSEAEREELRKLRVDVIRYRKEEGEVIDEASDNDNDNDDGEDSSGVKRKPIARRCAVSSEVNQTATDVHVNAHPKKESDVQYIKAILLGYFMFNTLSSADMHTIINSMEEQTFQPNETIVPFGSTSGTFYIVKCGTTTNGCKKGDCFHVNALLHLVHNTTEVKAVEKCVVWALHRETFMSVVGTSARMRRSVYEALLKKVEVFRLVDAEEMAKVVDVLKVVTVCKGDVVVREGEMGDVFYVVYKGECDVVKELKGKSVVIKRFREGDYFGERALVMGDIRFVSVVAVSEVVRLLVLDRNSFNRLLGPIEDILKRNCLCE
jgi:cAMP-dependent protein kinase regulator